MAAPLVTSVSVNPVLHDRAGAAPGDGNAERVNMQMRIKLSTTAPSWVQCPDNLVLMHGGRSFEVRVDPSQLASGQAHYAEVREPIIVYPVYTLYTPCIHHLYTFIPFIHLYTLVIQCIHTIYTPSIHLTHL